MFRDIDDLMDEAGEDNGCIEVAEVMAELRREAEDGE